MKTTYYKAVFLLFGIAIICADLIALSLKSSQETVTDVCPSAVDLKQSSQTVEPFQETALDPCYAVNDLTPMTSCCEEDWREPISLSVDWVYFKPIEDSLRYAIIMPEGDDINMPSIEQKFSYQSGVRVSAALPSACGRWQIGGSWLGFHSSPPQTSVKDEGFNILASYAVPAFGIDVNSKTNAVTGKWKLHLDVFDLVFKDRLFCDSKIVLSLYGGVKGGFIRQNLDVHYGDFEIANITSPTPQSFSAKSSYWGIGPVLGIEMNYPLCDSLHVFFNGSLGGVVGNFKLKSVYREFVDDPSENWRISDTKTSFSVLTQWQAGLQFSQDIGNFLFQLDAGWEANHWGGQMRINSLSTFTLPQNSGADLSFYGPFARLSLSF